MFSDVGQLGKLRAGWQPALGRVNNPPPDAVVADSLPTTASTGSPAEGVVGDATSTEGSVAGAAAGCWS
jgi:hypothetical protein